MGIPPNGKKVSVWMANIWRFADGKVVEWWFNLDTLGFMQQLGAHLALLQRAQVIEALQHAELAGGQVAGGVAPGEPRPGRLDRLISTRYRNRRGLSVTGLTALDRGPKAIYDRCCI